MQLLHYSVADVYKRNTSSIDIIHWYQCNINQHQGCSQDFKIWKIHKL